VADVRESTTAIETQTKLVGLAGGAFNQPDGAVPVFVVKLQEPPVGVAGAVAESLKMNHSKYVPPEPLPMP
jgi:hypothetical protein